MMLMEDLDMCCIGLDSNKANERRKCAETIKDLICKPKVIQSLNYNDRRRNWDYIYSSFHRFIKKEGEKLHQDENKQSKSSAMKFRLQSVSDTFLLIVTKANSDESRLSVGKIVETCFQCFDCSYMKKYFGFVYLKILVIHVLPIGSYWGQLNNTQWKDIYQVLKDLYKNPCDLDKETILRGLYLTIKYGSLHSNLNFLLQQEFEFIQNMCLDLTNNTNSIQQQTNTLQLLMSFSKQVSKDCRMHSSILGEQISRLLLDFLYHLRHEYNGDRKCLMFDYLLLQVRLHHPNGVLEGSDAAYAYNWDNWKTILRSLYSVLCNEVDVVLRYNSIGRRSQESVPELWPNFLELFVEVAKQVFNSDVLDVTQPSLIGDYTEFTQPPTKKRRIEIGIPALVAAIQTIDNWPWLSIIGKFLELYPNILQPHEFAMLLDVLATLQTECKDPISRHYLYKVLIEMVQTDESNENTNKELWTRIWETSLRSIGLNQNEETTHELIQIMLKHKNTISQPTNLLPIYLSGVLNVSKYCIETLYVLFGTVNIPETLSDIHLRKYLINLIINNERIVNNSEMCFDKKTAQVLVGLVLKMWPYSCNNKKMIQRKFKPIEDIYILTSFENGLICDKHILKQTKKENSNFLIHSETFTELTNQINTFLMFLCCNNKNINQLINGISLILNIISELTDLKILQNEEFVDVKQLFHILFESYKNQTNKNELLISVKHFEELLNQDLNCFVVGLVRNEISIDFLKIFFDLLNESDFVDGQQQQQLNDDMEDDQPICSNKLNDCLLNENGLSSTTEKLQLSAMRVLTLYAIVPHSESMQKKQKQVYDTLLQPDFDPKSNVDFQMTIYFLKALTTCKIGTLTDESIEFILNSLQKLLSAKYENYYAAILLLKILKDSIPHVNRSNIIDAKSNLLILLNPFYERKDSYGPELLTIIIECFGDIIKIDKTGKWPQHKQLTMNLLEFFKSNYHQVRLISIKNVLNLFHFDDSCKISLKRQQDLLPVLKQVIEDSFSVRDNLTDEQLIDEAANRTSSALHLYASLIVAAPMWRKHFLFTLIELVADKKIHTGLIQKVLLIICRYLNAHNFLNDNINYLITQWFKNDRRISEFPYKIFQCDTELIFYIKYKNVIVPMLLIQENQQILQLISQQMNKPIVDIITDCYPMIIGEFLPIFVYSKTSDVNKISGDDILNARRLFQQLNEMLPESLIFEMLDQIIIELLNRIYDCEHFQKQFHMSHILPESDPPYYNNELFQMTFHYIQNKMSQTTLIEYCTKHCANKLERILFETTANIYEKTSIEEKLIAMHRYSILIDIISLEFRKENELNMFFIRSVTNNLMNIIKLSEGSSEVLSVAACRYFKKFAAKCIPDCSTIFEKFLILIVSSLVPIGKLETRLSFECVEVLDFLIVANSKHLYNSIGALDPFPKQPKFAVIRDVYQKIKYGNDTFTLEQEIEHFLNVGRCLDAICDRTDGLEHLRQQLADKKVELNAIYGKLFRLRGFRGESVLHPLICMLVALTASPIAQVKLEAARCLGELGPSDLTTLVLKPEQMVHEPSVCPLELLAGRVIVLLARYLVNHDVRVAGVASRALYAVLGSKEGSNIIQNGDNIDYGCGILEKSYILPFLRNNRTPSTSLKISDVEFQVAIDQPDLWCPTTQNTPHTNWIITLVSELLKTFPDKCFLRDLIPVCKIKMEFAELLFPLITFLILSLNKPKCTTIISKQIQQFFETHWQETTKTLSQQQTNRFVVFNRASVQCMLNVVHFVRLHRNKIVDELKLNYLHVAQGAQYCSAYFTSILYAELWCYNKLNEKPYDNKSVRSILETVCANQNFQLTLSFENMLREGYKKIGDTDAMHGCGTSYILNTKSRIDYYKNIGHCDKVILYHNKQITGDAAASNDLIRALKMTGLHSLAFNIPTEDPTSKYECAWRLGNWTLNSNDDVQINFEQCHYNALKALHEQDYETMKTSIEKSRTCIINRLSHASLESSKTLYKSLTELKMLQDIENFTCAPTTELFSFWQTQNSLNKNDFEYVEPIRAQRITLLTDAFRRDETVKQFLVDAYLEMVDAARIEGVYHAAQQCLDSVSAIADLSADMRGRTLYAQAQLSWLDDKTSARFLLKHLLQNHEQMIPLELYGKALTLYGNWMVETRSENSATIIENYFEKALRVLADVGNTASDVGNRCETLDSLARFADAQYQQVSSYISSSSFESKIDIIKKSKVMALKIKHDKNTSDEKRAIALYEKQSKIDETEVDNAHKEKDMYLTLAVKNYLRILEYSDLYNLKIFRILSLSLDNKTNKDLLSILKRVLPTIASYKYIPLLPQLVPHIGGTNQNDVFERIIQEVLERCASDHPHHTLPTILAVADSHKDRNYDHCANGDAATEPRVHIAKQLLAKLKQKKTLTGIVNNMEAVSSALISLAYVDASKCGKRGASNCMIPRNEPIRMLRNVPNVLIPTISMEIRKHRNYTHIIGIQEFSGTFSMVGGVNAPKKITCTGTDGIKRTQLVKGKDDLRQDAVMQQVFNIMNTLLAKNKQTSNLFIRTYKVVPLSQRSGVIEWCENTEPLGTYLCDAHKRYHPTDWTPLECRNQLRATHLKDPNIKYRKYNEICEHLRPVFHMFFIASYPQSTVWFERRRAYMHSVATTSMVGYILGLGDRHVHNILLDTTTAEVVHIDFGIAFEQGKCLPTPETVPFRLTRDIEAGMGICGIEGVFRRSCEKTMQVLRQNAETVLTILQVLLYDPLYVWTITPAEAYSRQKDDDDKSIDFSDDSSSGNNNVNVTAERALLRLKEKLQGMENGAVCSVDGQVELLLQQARDPVNLSRLFNGWQPYL